MLCSARISKIKEIKADLTGLKLTFRTSYAKSDYNFRVIVLEMSFLANFAVSVFIILKTTPCREYFFSYLN